MKPPGRYSFIGRLVELESDPGKTLVVADVIYDVTAGDYVALLRQVSPQPSPGFTLPLTQLLTARSPRVSTNRDAATLLVAKCLQGAPISSAAIFSSRTIFKHYQFRPLIRYLGSPSQRILIADEPGLGKTIEAGYILVEELARSPIRRVLILCPAGLRTKWRQELWRRFGLQFDLVYGGQLSELLGSDEAFAAIASMDSLRARLAAPEAYGSDLDLLIIDEVHHLIGRSGDTLRRQLGMNLSRRSKRLVALSATPVQLGADDLRKVLGIVVGEELDSKEFEADMEVTKLLNKFMVRARSEPVSNAETSILKDGLTSLKASAELLELAQEIEDLPKGQLPSFLPRLLADIEFMSPFGRLLIRNRKKDVGEQRKREVVSHPVTLRGETNVGFQHGVEVKVSEQGLFRSIDRLLISSFSPVHRQQLSSCLPAMIGLLRDGMEGFPVWRRGDALLGPLDLLDTEDGGRREQALQRLGREEREACGKLADEFLLVGRDSKWEELRRILESLRKEPPQKAIVFTQWRPTLGHLREMAGSVRDPKCFFLTGDDNDWQVENVLQGFFNHDGRAALFATDFLSEGIDLQCADTVVNYDFPYNPMRVEQRVGRVDRIGQSSDVIHIHNLWVQGSLDSEILGLLRDRLNIFEESMGDVTDIIAIRPKGDSVELVSPKGWKAESLREIDRVGLFAGVEDFLDRGVEELSRRGAASFHPLVWLPVVKSLLVCGGGRARVVSESNEAVRVGPISDEDIEVVAQWVGKRDAGLVRIELESYRDSVDNCVTVSKNPKSEGLFVSPAHPLCRAAIAVSLNSEGFTEHTKPILVAASGSNIAETAIYRYPSSSPYQSSELALWKRDGPSSFSRLDRQAVSSLLHELEDEAALLRPCKGTWLPPKELVEAVNADFQNLREMGSISPGARKGQRARAPAQVSDRTAARPEAEFIAAILQKNSGDLDGTD